MGTHPGTHQHRRGERGRSRPGPQHLAGTEQRRERLKRQEHAVSEEPISRQLCPSTLTSSFPLPCIEPLPQPSRCHPTSRGFSSSPLGRVRLPCGRFVLLGRAVQGTLVFVGDAPCVCPRGLWLAQPTCDGSSATICLSCRKICRPSSQLVGFFCTEQSQRDHYGGGGGVLHKAPC